MINSCLFYDKTLNKIIPCFLVPNQVYTKDHRKFVNITFDQSKFNEYGTNSLELARYSSFTVRLIDLYPNTSPEELAYAQACIPNLIANSNTFEIDEINRFKKLVDMVLNTSQITSDTFYKLADFLSYEVLFLYLQPNERKFMLTIATVQLNIQNVDTIIAVNGGINNIKLYLQTCLKLFTSYAYIDNNYYVQNIMNLANTSVTFPLVINVPLMQANIQYLQDNNHLN